MVAAAKGRWLLVPSNRSKNDKKMVNRLVLSKGEECSK